MPAAFTVSVGWGFYVLIIGTAMVALGGLVMLINRDSGSGDAATA